MSEEASLDDFAEREILSEESEVAPPTELTDTPPDWDAIRLENVAHDEDGAFVDGPFGSNLKADEMLGEGFARVVQLQNIRPSEFVDTNHRYISKTKFDQLARHGATPGDLVIAKMSEPVARACVLPEIEDRYIVVADCIKLSVDDSEHNSIFVMFAMNSRPVWKQAFARSRGSTRKRINLTQLKEVQIPNPPIEEQRKIASVLTNVEKAIKKTKDVITQLERVKNGARQDLLTRGITGTGALRESTSEAPNQFENSITWTIPKSWELEELGEVCDIQVGYAFKSEWYLEEGDVRVLRGANVGYGQPDWSETYYLEPGKVPDYEEYRLKSGDIIIGMDRPYTSTGFKVSRLSETDTPALLVQRVGRYEPHGLNRDYLHVVLDDWRYQKQVIRRAQGMDIPHISKTDILAPKIPRPPMEEQRRIAMQYSSFLERIESEKVLLSQYKRVKHGLNQDLLSGKVRTTDTNIEVLPEVAAHG